MNTHTNVRRFTQLQAETYKGRKVRTTSGQVGVVVNAHPSGDGTRIFLHIWNGSYSVQTDTEHATVVK